jgi:hypothetical protein
MCNLSFHKIYLFLVSSTGESWCDISLIKIGVCHISLIKRTGGSVQYVKEVCMQKGYNVTN